jgi:cytochrome c biogenesis protein CcdA
MSTTLLFAFVAGTLSLLSPCTLPLLPILLASALSIGQRGAFALALGLTTSFTVLGLFVALIGHGIGLTEDRVRFVGAVTMIGFGVVLLAPAVETRVSVWLEPLGSWAARRFGGGSGLAAASPSVVSQGAIGLALGAIWTPCIGPTLGAAALMASRGENIPQVALTMLAFGLGAGAPLVLLGLLPQRIFASLRGALASGSYVGRRLLGAVLAGVGLAIATGLEKQIEIAFLKAMPTWLLELTTRF